MRILKQNLSAQNVGINIKMVTVISTFAGCGGSSLGYKLAGYDELLAIDFDSHAVESFKLNFPEVPVWERDLTKVSAEEILDFCNLKPGELDVLDGSPPCQGFSTAGKRDVNDPRNILFESFVNLINGLKPKVFIMENVPGMVRGKMKGHYLEIMKALRDTGYNVKSAIMDASFYDVPQARKRVIFIGSDPKFNEPSFPKPNKRRMTLIDVPELSHIKSLNSGQYQKVWSGVKKPAPTITKTRSLYILDKEGAQRYPTIEEVKLMCSFPKDFQLTGSESSQWARMGNAVMPNFMHHIAKHVKEVILNDR